jgi:hypothetical protein
MQGKVVTLVDFGQWQQPSGERVFCRYALNHLRPAFPTLSERKQFNHLKNYMQPGFAYSFLTAHDG